MVDYQILMREKDCSLDEMLDSLKENGEIIGYYRFKTGHYAVYSENPAFVTAFEGNECIESIIESPKYRAIEDVGFDSHGQ
ncbi:MAG TPA: hypothetical protein VJB90_03425 [Candidatus Nanoarchaeia archaeon]|nr:hypothetical protein [Candidatus Nanoarchaeia archaeon]